MSAGTVSGIMTTLLLVIFLGIVIWAWSGKRKKDFNEASRLPLEDEKTPKSQETNRDE
ncbi:cbb3-type cytochrome oxidase subunit 3 [Alkalilimnicola sp. S0819]|uniref:cbb3-type cytochrome oxidase subunit 3 n=1 Tax=Alkalilimnicola sp. S0819 TaxID=2613922 RepID=UPI001261CF9E|nr:cbb3-type cytochrome c oxidase subunit 3 [Alkalilimnicola sp. S0819]KAB7628200.1 cbb3-type cytochrome c oxidase subunit 3 [Alkalilimnicola sp. S0819]MPQ15090.1 CcoQ/FixQ family Cbb3-type cytochrome c oxidase assembly chaperone [Alkalilimnicola sp. S0819]